MMHETEQLLAEYLRQTSLGMPCDPQVLGKLLKSMFVEIDDLRNEVETAQTTADDAYNMANEAQGDINHLTIVRR